MVQVLGNATTGNTYNDVRVDLPRDTSTIRPAHRPWCVDCKRKDRELDSDQRCPQCARAAVTRAEGAARRAAAEQATAEAKKVQKHSTTTQKPPMEGKQGKPTTRSSAPRATQTSDVPDRGRTPGRAPGVGSSAHREKNPPTVQETRPVTVGGPTAEQILDAQVENAAALLRDTANHPHPAVQAERAAVIAGLEALRLLVELTTPASRPAPVAQPKRGHGGPERMVLPTEQIIAAYKAGQTLGQIAEVHRCSGPTIARLLEENGVPRRGAPVPRTTELTEQIRRLYEDEHLTQAEIAERIGQTVKVVHNVMREAGIDRRPAKARHGRDNAQGLKQKIADLGVTAAEIKLWAITAGHLDQMHRGLPRRELVDAYAAAHRKDSVA